ncbi:MAG: PAS domain-containing protein, partial [Bacteroidota bacterium]
QKSGEQLILALIKDISEEKNLSESLSRKDSMIQMGEAVALTGTFIWDTKTTEMEASPGIFNIFELDPETTTPQNLFDKARVLIHPDDIEQLLEDVAQSVKENAPSSSQYRIKLPDGRIKWLRTISGPFIDDRRMLRTIQDITEEVRQQSQLDHQKAINILGELAASLGTFVWDIETNVLEVSEGMARMLGIHQSSEKQVNSLQDLLAFIHPDDRELVYQTFQQLKTTRTLAPVECRIISMAGAQKWMRFTEGAFTHHSQFVSTFVDISQEKQQNILLMRQNSMLAMGVAGANLASFIWDSKKLSVLISLGIEGLYEIDSALYSEKELFHKLVSMTHPDDAERFQTNLNMAIRGKLHPQFDIRIILESGAIKWIRVYPCEPLLANEKLATLQDITKDVAQASLLRQQREFIEIGEKTAGLGTFIWNVETNDVQASPGYYHVYGLDSERYDSSKLMAKVLSMTHPEDVGYLQQNISVITEGRRSSPIDYRVILDSGEVKWIRTSPGRFISSADKLGTVQDITAEKNKTLALQQQEEMVRIGGEVGNIGVDIYDMANQTFIYSPHLLKMFHLDPQKITTKNLGKALEERFYPEDQEMIKQFRAALTENPPERVEIIHRLLLPNHDIRWMQVISDKFKDTHFRITIHKDITEYVHQSEKLKSSHKEIEELLYSVSHDLRAPLRHVNSYAQMLEASAASKLDAEETKNLQNVLSASRRLGFMIDELLQFFRNKQVEIKNEEVNLDTITRATQEIFSQDTAKRGIQWTIGALPIVQGDRNMLEKVMQNLISNAVKFTARTPQAKIDISAEVSPEEGWVHVQVKDNGAGFNMDYADKLFAVFQRLHTRRQFEGTGIGLANVKRIIEKHGGSIWAEAAVNQGASFHFTLPFSAPPTEKNSP